jgi:FtsP/CotA-like multicopper oxidase with cupredoxin domain
MTSTILGRGCTKTAAREQKEAGSPEYRDAAVSSHAAPAGLSRRAFIGGAIASVGALAVGIPAPGRAARGGGGGGKGTVTRHQLHIPVTVSPTNHALGAAPATANLGDGVNPIPSSVWAYDLSFPGPTFRANSGDSVNVQFTNGLLEETTVHWHGMIVPGGATDGHPRFVVAPGAYNNTYYQYPIVQRACMNWYHPHPHMMTGEQVCLGLAGAFIVNDAEEAALGLPSGAYEVPLIVRDAKLDRAGNLTYTSKSSGFLGNIPLVNGTRDPYHEVAAGWYRFRVLNGANARLFRLALSNGAPFTVIGNDGGLLETATSVGQIEFGPGERLDLLVDFSGLPVGTKVMLRDVNAGWDLLEFRVTQQSGFGDPIPAALSTIPALSAPVTTREFSFDGMSRINGREYDLNRIDFQVPFGQTELWRFTTGGNAPHPVHVHGASFQVQSRSGGRGQLFPWEGGWKDTVLLEDGETVEVLIRFDHYQDTGADDGLYLLHCHKLEHEDMGMMANFEVV